MKILFYCLGLYHFLFWNGLFGQDTSQNISRGEGSFIFTDYKPLAEKPIKVFYYIPQRGKLSKMRILFSMHGAERSGALQRNVWKNFAEDYGFIVLAPQFDKTYYNENDYQFGGVSKKADQFELKPKEEWTYQAIEAIFDYFKKETGNKAEKYDMFGHSAGGQFVVRYTLAMPNARLNTAVAANPGSYTFPLVDGLLARDSINYGWPYSIKGTPFSSLNYLKEYFAKKLIIQVGTADTAKEGGDVPTAASAVAQGSMRYERGWNFYKLSTAIAYKNVMPFNWRIVEVKDAAHGSLGMVHGKPVVKYHYRNGQKIYDINDITQMGAFSLLFE